MLAKALVHVDFDSLPVVRDPLAPDPDDWRMYRRTGYWSTDWNDYTVYSTASNDDLRDYMYSALLDAQYGYHADLIDLVAAHSFPDDPALMAKHLNPKRLDPRLLDDLIADLDSDTFDVDSALNSLADDMYDRL